MRKLFKKILRILAKRVISRYKPIVVGVTGSVGKTTAKEAIYTILSRKMPSRKNEENYNNEFGIPMTVLGIPPLKSKSIFERLNLIDQLFSGVWLAYGWPQSHYPKALVLELGADKPGDIPYLVDIVRPQIGVITAVGEVPVHVEFYSSPQAVAKEKSQLIKNLPANGRAILNYDDEIVRVMQDTTKTNVSTFGFSKKADVRVSEVTYFINDAHPPSPVGYERAGKKVGGLSFKIHQDESFIPARIEGIVAPHQIYSLLAATAVATHLGINLVEISEAFERIEFPKGRMRLLHGIEDSVIIDDTYNAAPLSTHAALEALKGFAAATRKVDRKHRRKVAILGDMRELGKYTEDAHKNVGDSAAEVADVVIAVGSAAVFIAQVARKKLGEERVVHFETVNQLIQQIRDLIKPKDIVLVKGSQSVRLEKAVRAILDEPGRAEELLVRQHGEWLES